MLHTGPLKNVSDMKLDHFMPVGKMTQELLDITNIIKTYSSINTKQINYATKTQLMLLQIYQYYLFLFWPEESFELDETHGSPQRSDVKSFRIVDTFPPSLPVNTDDSDNPFWGKTLQTLN